jgi:hypothetical protein
VRTLILSRWRPGLWTCRRRVRIRRSRSESSTWKLRGKTGDLEASGKGRVAVRQAHDVAVRQAHDVAVRQAHDVAGSNAAKGLEESHWLCPIENRRRLDSSREGMIEGLSVGSYLLLIDFTGRLFRDGKAAISAEVAGILERLGSNAESWWCRIEKLCNGRLLGRFFAVNRQRLRDVARRLGVHHLANLGGCPAR